MSGLTSQSGKYSTISMLALCAALAIAWPVDHASAQSADTIFFNGKILTVDKEFSVQQALAIGMGRSLPQARRPR